MAVYNDAAFLKEAIESILTQTFDDFEFIIIDDGSTDESPSVLLQYAKRDTRIRVISASHGGLTKALNRGIASSSGEFIARMDADDVSERGRFEKQISFMEAHPSVGLCGTLGTFLSVDGSRLGNKDLPTTNGAIKQKLLFNNQFIHSSWMIRRPVIDDVGTYDESFTKSQDYELAFRIAQSYDVANLSDRLIAWRVRGGSLSWSSKAQEWHALRARWYAITRYGYSWVRGCAHIVFRCAWMCIPQRLKMKRYAH